MISENRNFTNAAAITILAHFFSEAYNFTLSAHLCHPTHFLRKQSLRTTLLFLWLLSCWTSLSYV